MPWGQEKPSVLSDADIKILTDVRESCRDLMSKLSELDAYVVTLHEAVAQRTNPQGGCDDRTSTPQP